MLLVLFIMVIQNLITVFQINISSERSTILLIFFSLLPYLYIKSIYLLRGWFIVIAIGLPNSIVGFRNIDLYIGRICIVGVPWRICWRFDMNCDITPVISLLHRSTSDQSYLSRFFAGLEWILRQFSDQWRRRNRVYWSNISTNRANLWDFQSTRSPRSYSPTFSNTRCIHFIINL